MLPENVSERGIRQRDTEILERAFNRAVTPGRILLRHADYQFGDVLLRTRTANTSTPVGVILLLRHQFPIPT
jgi:hypothetical protein